MAAHRRRHGERRTQANRKIAAAQNENESHQRRDATASLPPRPGLPCITHRAESIPSALDPFSLTHFPLTICPFLAFLSIFKLDGETRYREQRGSTDSQHCR